MTKKRLIGLWFATSRFDFRDLLACVWINRPLRKPVQRSYRGSGDDWIDTDTENKCPRRLGRWLGAEIAKPMHSEYLAIVAAHRSYLPWKQTDPVTGQPSPVNDALDGASLL